MNENKTEEHSDVNCVSDITKEIIVVERICTDLSEIEEESRSRVLLVVQILLGIKL